MRLLAFTLLIALLNTRATEFPPVVDLGPTNEYGSNLQYSMRLLNEGDPENKRTVRVMIYGQSVSQQSWWLNIAEWLKTNHPTANVIVSNRSIGYVADLLTRTADADVISFYPDLLIYHNFGTPAAIEGIVARVRARTTADILLQTDHPSTPEHLAETTDPGAGGLSTDAWRNYVAFRQIAARYGAEWGDVRSIWKRYLASNELAPADLLSDHVHLNEHGNFVMSEILRGFLRPNPVFTDDNWRDAVRTIPVGDEPWTSLTIPFAGNRVDLVLRTNSATPISVTIDGKKPSEFPELYSFKRVEFYPGTYWPCIVQVQSKAPLIDESWKAVVTESITNNGIPHIRFEVHGSKTGYDGAGVSTNDFVSNSGRVAIRSEDWLMLYWAWTWFPTVQPLPVGYEIRWESESFAIDRFVPEIGASAYETTVTVAQGLANGPHTLTLTSLETSAIEAIRIYNPAARTQPRSSVPAGIQSVARNGNSLTLRVTGTGRYVLEGTDDLSTWHSLTAPRVEPEITVQIPDQRRFLRFRKLD